MGRSRDHGFRGQWTDDGRSHRHWCFTLNNYMDDHIEWLSTLADNDGGPDCIARYVVFGEEVGESGTPHLQGYIEFLKPHRLHGVRGLLKHLVGGAPHLEPRLGGRSRARDYCRKGEQTKDEWHKHHESGPNWGLNAIVHEHGSWIDGPGARTDLDPYRELITRLSEGATDLELADHDPITYSHHFRGLDRLRAIYEKERAKTFRHVRVHTVIGMSDTGKTSAARLFDRDVFIANCANDQFPLNGYDGEKTIMLDDFRGNIQYTQFLRILDGHPLAVNVKYGLRWAQWTTIIISSNTTPDTWYKVGLTPELKRRLNTGTNNFVDDELLAKVANYAGVESSTEDSCASSLESAADSRESAWEDSCESSCESVDSIFLESSDSVDLVNDSSTEEHRSDPPPGLTDLPARIQPLVWWLVDRFKVSGNTAAPAWSMPAPPRARDLVRPTAGSQEVEYASVLDSLLDAVYPPVATRGEGS